MPALGLVAPIAGALGASVPAGLTTALSLLGGGLGVAQGIANKDPFSIITSLLPVGGDIAKGVAGAASTAAKFGSDALSSAATAANTGADAVQSLGAVGDTLNAYNNAKPAYQLLDFTDKIANPTGYAAGLSSPAANLIPSGMENALGPAVTPEVLSMSAPDLNKFHFDSGGGKKLGLAAGGGGSTMDHVGEILGGLSGATSGVMSVINAFKDNKQVRPFGLPDMGAGFNPALGANSQSLPGMPNVGYPTGDIQAPQEKLLNLPGNDQLLQLLHAYSV